MQKNTCVSPNNSVQICLCQRASEAHSSRKKLDCTCKTKISNGLKTHLDQSFFCVRPSPPSDSFLMKALAFLRFLSPGVGMYLNRGMKSTMRPNPNEAVKSSKVSTNLLKIGSSSSKLKKNETAPATAAVHQKGG